MREEKNSLNQAVWDIMEQLLDVTEIGAALSGSLEIMVRTLKSEAGAIWILDKKSDRLLPMYHFGPVDVSGISIENGEGMEGIVARSGKSVCIEDAENDQNYKGTVFDDFGLHVRSMIIVPLKAVGDTIGCIQIVNKTNKRRYTREELELMEHMAAIAALTIEENGIPMVEEEEKEVLIRLEDVIKEFQNPGRVSRVLKGINLNIFKGELLVIEGESGCGKSTLMNIIGGMDYLTSGKVLVEGNDYSHPTDQELTMFRRHYIGFIFQSYNLMPNLNAYDNVRFIAELCDEPMPVQEALNIVGLGEKAKSFPAMMSGGQQQRVAIARALVKNPRLILADEPTAALDYETSIEVLSAIENAAKTRGTTVIMITHNPEIGKMANRVVKLKGGKVFSIRTNPEPLHAEQLEW